MTLRQTFGMVMLAAAALFGAADMWFTVVPSYGAEVITMGRLWALLSVRSLHMIQTLITGHLWTPIWDLGVWPLLVTPAWTFFGALGFLFIFLGRARTADR